MEKFIILLVCCFSSCLAVKAQVSGGLMGGYGPPSPEASSLGKYIDHPVGFYTGTPKIDIPLFEIVTGRIKVPISLSYHASGVKVDEIASRVGIGFSLNAGGVVSKVVNTFPDEGAGGYFDPLNRFINGYQPFFGEVQDMASSDLEPDAHYYSFASKSGKIYFKDRSTPFAENGDPIKIIGPYNGDKKFVITTEDGIIYKFEAEEGLRQMIMRMGGGVTSVGYSYYLTEILDPVSLKNVKFIYRTDMPASIGYTEKRFYAQSLLSCFLTSDELISSGANIEKAKVLQRIEYEGGFIEFKADHSRQDLVGDRAYTEINQYVHELALGTPIFKKGVNFNYTYTSSGTTMEGKRLYLESIQEKGSDGTFLPPYAFSYKNRGALPPRNSFEQDIWGYYNANSSTSGSFPKVYVYNNMGKCSYLPIKIEGNGASSIVPGIDRSGNPLTMDYGVLDKIVYPTKGYTTYEYEPHTFGYEINTVNLNTYGSFKQGGIRVKEIKSFSPNGELLLNKSYSYSLGHLGGALPQVAVPIASYNPYLLFSQNQSLLGSNQGSYVGYGEVIERTKDELNKVSATIYHYSKDADIEGSFNIELNTCSDLTNLADIRRDTFFPFFKMQSLQARRGILLKEEHFKDFIGVQQEQPLKKTEYTYDLSAELMIRVSHASSFGNGASRFWGSRNLNQEKMLLTSKKEVEFTASGDSIISRTDYSYTENKHFLRSKTIYSMNNEPYDPMITSVEKGIQTVYKYPFDYAASASAGIMGTMVDMNYINAPISEVIKTLWNPSNYSTTYYVEAKITNYKYSAPYGPLPHEVFRLKASEIENAANYPLVNPTDPANPGSKYEKRVDYKYNYCPNPSLVNYDGKGEIFVWSPYDNDVLLWKLDSTSPLSYTETFSLPPQGWNNVYDPNAMTGSTSFVWSGYDVPFPLSMNGGSTTISFWARGGNFTLEIIAGDYLLINEVAPENWKYYTYTIPASEDWRDGQVYLRGTAKLDEVSMGNYEGLRTSYGYDAYRRLKYKISPSGNMETYEYDPFGRLKCLKDNNGNIIRSYNYNYKQ